jgi:catechol 2,3-dioxygenase
VHLSVADLRRSIAYHQTVVGLRVLERDGGRVSLGAGGRELLVLVEEAGARPAAGHTGLYHFALLVPRRADLARWLAHAARDRVRLVGLSDHFVSEAIYFSDPDGHGIEIYWDRPREVWEGQVAARMTTLPLDVDSLLGELDDPRAAPFDGLPGDTVMGHVHLKVAEITQTVAFYRDVLGLGLMARLGRQAAFLSAGGYHHHLGANTWESAGAPPPPAGAAALRHATLVLPDAAERARVLERVERTSRAVEDTPDGPMIYDPSGNAVVLARRAQLTRGLLWGLLDVVGLSAAGAAGAQGLFQRSLARLVQRGLQHLTGMAGDLAQRLVRHDIARRGLVWIRDRDRVPHVVSSHSLSPTSYRGPRRRQSPPRESGPERTRAARPTWHAGASVAASARSGSGLPVAARRPLLEGGRMEHEHRPVGVPDHLLRHAAQQSVLHAAQAAGTQDDHCRVSCSRGLEHGLPDRADGLYGQWLGSEPRPPCPVRRLVCRSGCGRGDLVIHLRREGQPGAGA